MKKKVGIIASSVATIAVCASMVVGSTYALFTSEDKVDIAITSGNVEVTAVAQNLKTDYDKEYVTSSNVEADIAGNTVSLNNMTPGDIVTFDIVVENKSTVSIKYRTSIKCSEGLELMSGLEFTVGEGEEAEDYSGLVSYVSTWTDWAEAGKVTVPVTISLPGDAGNEYKNLSCKIAYAVEAVQGNTTPSDEEAGLTKLKVSTAEELNSALAYVSENGGTVTLMNDISVTEAYKFNSVNETIINLNEHKLTINKINGAGLDIGENSSLTLVNGTVESGVNGNLLRTANNSSLKLDGVTAKPKYGTAVVIPATSTVKITNSKVTGTNPVSTDAANACTPTVVIENSTLTGVFTGILFNVDGTLTVNNSTLTGINYGAVIRSGDVTFTNCTLGNNNTNIKNFPADDVNAFNGYYEAQWNKGGTDNIPLNTLVVGNKNPGGGYGKYADVTLINTELVDGFIGKDVDKDDSAHTFEHHKIYGYGITDSYATVTYDKATAELSNLVDGDVRLDNNATTKKIDLTISTVAELQAFADEVNGGNNYAGKLVVLANDIDLSGINWTPIGNHSLLRTEMINGNEVNYYAAFSGTFDGSGHTISNLVYGNESTDYAGLFGYAENATIKNVILANFKIVGREYVAALVGRAYFRHNLITNITVEEATLFSGHFVGAIAGWIEGTIDSCKVIGSDMSVTPYIVDGVYDNGDKAGALAGALGGGNYTNNEVTDCTVAAYRDFGGLFGNIQGTAKDAGFSGITYVTGNKLTNVTLSCTEVPEGETYPGHGHENVGSISGRFSKYQAELSENICNNVTLVYNGKTTTLEVQSGTFNEGILSGSQNATEEQKDETYFQ